MTTQDQSPTALLQALQESSRQIMAHDDFKETARAIYTILKKYIGSGGGYVALLSKDEKANELLFLDAGGLSCRMDPTLPMPVRGMRAEAYRTGQVIYRNNFLESPWADFLPKNHARLENVLFAPLKIKETVVGVIGLANKPGGFTEQDAQAAGIFGELAAIAFDKLQTAEHLKISEEHFRAVAQTATDAIISTDREGRIIYWNFKAEVLFGYSEPEILGSPMGKLLPERFQERHAAAMERVRRDGILHLAGKTMEFIGKHRNGHELPIEISLSCWESNGGVYFTAIIRDITKRKQAEEALSQAQIRLEDKVLERTAELTRANETLKNEIKTRVHMENALAESDRKFRAIFNQTFQVIGLLDPDGTVLEINQTALDYFHIDYRDSLGKPLWELRRESATETNRNIFKDAIAQAAKGQLVRFEVPILFAGDVIRTMDFSIKPVLSPGGLVPLLIIEGRDITERKRIELTLKESENQQRLHSYQVLQAQEKERKRIAQELHDGIGQYLSAIKYRVEHLMLTHLGREEKVSSGSSSLENVIPVIQGAIEEIRRICMDLRPSILDDLGILATISWFCREFQTTYSDIRIKQKIQVQEEQIPALLKTVIFRIIQEALNNIGKHSQAGQIRLNLVQKDHHLQLDIRDNGVGFDLKSIFALNGSTRGMGLAGMEERAKLSGGTFAIRAQPGKGTRIQAAWPLEETDAG